MNTKASVTLFLFLAWGGASTWWYACKIKGNCISAKTETAVVEPVMEVRNPETPKIDSVAPKAVVETVEKVTILFTSGSVKQEKNDEIDNYIKLLAEQLKSNGKKIIVVGHTDDTGENNLNEQLGLERAESVKSTLVNLGVDPAIITCISNGETEPVSANTTEAGKRLNRRVEITFN